MGSDITVFLEFYGLPGCGKSTISHLVAEELRKRGKTVREPTYEVDNRYSTWKRRTIKFLKMVRYSLIHPRRFKELLKLVKANGYHGFDVLSQSCNITLKLWEYDYAYEDYVIFDEGLTQSAIALVQDQKNSSENEECLYDLCRKRNVIKFYIKINKDTSQERMRSRNKHDSRIEQIIDISKKIKAIQTFELQCELIPSGLIISEFMLDDSVRIVIGQLN